ncbi:MAG: Gfo/Idh/MocA family oxidoreductase [Acidobacteria bacterium]|nr:Gfo/Idh/MocA family oxidoreductase [Acidobacteriota bacterium]
MSHTSRRYFLGALTAAGATRVWGANDRVQVGFIGYGLIGAQHVFDFKNQRDVDCAAMSDAYQPRMEEGARVCGPNTRQYADFRKLLDDKDLQAVVVSTPDHWHCMHTLMACAAGKDVYVEKPMTLFIKEGRWMIDVARRTKRVVQCGTQQRSGRHYQSGKKLLNDGYLGKIHSVRMGSFRNINPGFGRPAGDKAPTELAYDMWLGPAPARPYSPHRSLYHFRWFWDYSGGQMTNLAAHEIDILQWWMGVKGPTSVTSTGGRFVLKDDGETPDTQDALFEYPGFTAVWSHREGSRGRAIGKSEYFGEFGSLSIARDGWEVHPDNKVPPENAVPQFRGQPTGGVNRVEVKPEQWVAAKKEPGSSNEQFDLHVRNFLDCIKTRQRPIADVEEGHKTAVACHLANISLRTGRKLRWDADKEEIIGDKDAQAMTERPYRKPWDGVLRSILKG